MKHHTGYNVYIYLMFLNIPALEGQDAVHCKSQYYQHAKQDAKADADVFVQVPGES